MAARPDRMMPGKHLRGQLDEALAPGCEWDERELIALDLVEDAADRAAVLRELFEVETALPQVSTRHVTELAAEIRPTEATIAKLVPDPDAAPTKIHATRLRKPGSRPPGTCWPSS